ncbi:MAG: beta-lactamase family protein [Lachnospiraceae bacterium]|nr:beta-lactamase family protein [Lachnospiraceae bacterium]
MNELQKSSEIQKMSEFRELTEFLDTSGKRWGVPESDCIISREGEIIYRHRTGSLQHNTKGEAGTYWLYSATKIATCVAAMQLIECGKLALSDPVSKYLPEFASLTVRDKEGKCHPAKTELTVFHLMTMTGGLDYDLGRPALKEALKLPEEEKTTRNIVAALAADPLLFDPGEHFKYSFCHDVLGAVIEAAAGQRLEKYMQMHIFQPLGMSDTTFCPDSDKIKRMRTQYIHTDSKGTLANWNQDNEWRFSVNYDSGGAGLLSTVEDYILLLSALSMGGSTADGRRILKEETIAEMAHPRLNAVQQTDFLTRSAAMKGYSYGLGVRVLVDNKGIDFPLGEFGWDGAAGAYALVDPYRHIAMYYSQHVYNCPIVYQRLHPALRDVAGRCLKQL